MLLETSVKMLEKASECCDRKTCQSSNEQNFGFKTKLALVSIAPQLSCCLMNQCMS